MDTKQMSVGEEEGKKDSLFHLQKSVLRITWGGKMRSVKKIGRLILFIWSESSRIRDIKVFNPSVDRLTIGVWQVGVYVSF